MTHMLNDRPDHWHVAYPDGKLGDTGCYVLVKGTDPQTTRDPANRISFTSKSGCIHEAQRRNGYTPQDGSEQTYATQLENDPSIHGR